MVGADAGDVTGAGTLASVALEEPASRREARAAVAIAGGLYFVGSVLCASAALLPHVSSPVGVIAVACDALLTSGLLLLAADRGWGGLGLACVAELWGVGVIAVLCASAGGPGSPFALIYFFALGHAAAFQPRWRLVGVAVATLIAFLAPLLYEPHVSSKFAAIACVGIVLALLAALVMHAALSRLREQRRRMEVLVAATATLDSSLDPAQTLSTIANMAVPDLAQICVIDLLDDTGSVASTVVAAVAPELAAGVQRMREQFPLDMRSGHPVAQVLSGRVPHSVSDLTEDGALARAAQSAEHERFMRDAGFAHAAVFPLVARGRTRGAISFLQLHGDARHDRNLLAVLEDMAGRAALALDNARLYAERDEVASTLRRSLMPALLPVVPGLELASHFRPSAAGSEVGGDFYDVFTSFESCWLVVGDVCGKGAQAAVLTAFLRHTTAAYAHEGIGPGSVLARVNQTMLKQDLNGRFATAIVARLRWRGARVELTVALAGHPAALVVRAASRSAEELGGTGALLGVFVDPEIEEVTTMLEAGDALALYTDGLPEAHAPARMIGVGEMVEQLSVKAPVSAPQAIDALLDLLGHEDGLRDDIAILSARVRAGAGQAPETIAGAAEGPQGPAPPPPGYSDSIAATHRSAAWPSP
ncbi:MAG: PP2C family protein-serine/threonine phosphatase [Solirubrobacteraceae bacterium]